MSTPMSDDNPEPDWHGMLDDLYEADRQESEREWAERFIVAFDECVRLGILDGTADDERTTTLAEMQGWLANYGGVAPD